MQHASDTNRKDRAQKAARREKFSGNHYDKTSLDDSYTTKLDFFHLTPEQIAEERQRIEKRRIRERKKRIITMTIATVFTFGLFILGYYLLIK